jgi:two-component system, NtrC family, C4-dicarboxylate transport sensor histidine kinase DctB
MSDASPDPMTDPDVGAPGPSWRIRLAIAVLIVFAVGVVLFTNQWLTQRFTETTRSRAELRLALYSGNILTELQRNSVVPLLLARDPELIGALNSGNFAFTSQRLISFQSRSAQPRSCCWTQTGG